MGLGAAGETGAGVVDATFVLTLKLDPVSFERVQALRKAHFPPAVNWLPAHLTLLHQASRAQISRLRSQFPFDAAQIPLCLRFTGPKPLGRGVAIDVACPQLGALRSRLMDAMSGDFTRQDLQPFHAHVTIQNKVEAAAARSLLASLQQRFEPWTGVGEALLVWRYLGGPWELESEHRFQRAAAGAVALGSTPG